jgi:hypothetical protein
MITLISSAGRSGWPGRVRPLAGAVAVAAGLAALAAGCGTTHASGTSSAPTLPPSSAAGSSAAGSSAVSGSAAATPVPTVAGGTVTAGAAACAGWPSGAASTRLPALFVPVTVEQCVTGIEAVPGKGTWETATLERATTGLAPLVNALRAPGQTREPGTFCSDVAMIPPQLVLISGSGEKVVPRIPVTGCGVVRSGVLSALAGLSWQPLSIRLVAQVSPNTMSPQTMKPGGSPKSIQTVAGVSS